VISGQPENKRLEDPGLKGVLATPLISLVLWISWRGWKRGRQPVLGKVWKPKQNLSPEAASATFPPVWCFQGTLAGNHQSAPWCITAAVNLDVVDG